MQHVVASSAGFGKVLFPLGEGPHPFGNNSQHGDAIEGDRDSVAWLDKGGMWCDGKGLGIDNGGAAIGVEDGIDVEVAFAALDAGALGAIVLEPVDKCAGVRDGQIDLDGLGKVGGQPEMVRSGRRNEKDLLALHKVVPTKFAAVERKVCHEDAIARCGTASIDCDTQDIWGVCGGKTRILHGVSWGRCMRWNIPLALYLGRHLAPTSAQTPL